MSVVPFPIRGPIAPLHVSAGAELSLEVVAQALASADANGPVLVGLIPRHNGVDLHLQSIPDDPLGALVGWHAPHHWLAAGLVGPGIESLVDPCGEAPPVPVSVAILVDRSGDLTVARKSEAARGSGPRWAEGRLADIVRRMLQLPTPPAPWSPGRLWTAVWFDAVLTLATDRRPDEPSPGWRAVAACHPVPAALAVSDPLRPDHLVQLADHSLVESWETLRVASVVGQWHWPDTPAVAAEWFDAGSFGRWLLGLYPTPAELLEALRDMVAPSVHAALQRVGEAWQALDDGDRIGQVQP